MSQAINRYKADLRELYFALFEQFDYSGLAASPTFADWDVETTKSVLKETYKFVCEVLGPLNSIGDKEGCKIVDGQVRTPSGFKEAFQKMYETGIKQMAVPKEFGGQGAPHALYVLTEELTAGANTALNMYPGLAWGAAEVIAECGTDEQKKKYAERMFNGVFGGTMCLTEPHAGSDVGSATTKAVKQADGRYKISGTKIYITGGDHDLTENIVQLVLARIEGAAPGTKGLSLFIVPKFHVNADGSSGKRNDVWVASLEHKMGINGSATCVLNFGENGDCYGELVGSVEHQGMPQMFRMMNGARIAVGIQGLAVTSSAYLNALDYAKDRKQGAHFTKFKDPSAPRVPIFQHADIRRSLLEMKAHVEGIRALIVKLGGHRDYVHVFHGKDDAMAAYHQGQVDLLTPLVKAYATEEAYRLCGNAIQVYGGAGFLKDWPVEQYARDSKIFTIYEGTTHIQAMDLVGRKLGQNGGSNFQAFMGDIGKFVEKNASHKSLGKEVKMLSDATETLMSAAMALLAWSQEKNERVSLVPLSANRMLNMMSQVAVAWLLLDAAVIAEAKLAAAPAGHEDIAFYQGKVQSGQWYARNVLPMVKAQAEINMNEDLSPMITGDASFATC
jgi:alkylation response protein AidB-like acyl-CoA dehydrogenase